MEITFDALSNQTTFVTYMGGDAYGAPAIWRSEQTSTTTEGYYYLFRDYLGSVLAITDSAGLIQEKRIFDAWGEIALLQDGNGNNLSSFTILDRGYTGHEHLLSVGLVHMNGRLYDPKLHRFLMPDNYVQDPYNTQNFNRYGYVLNNPLKYTDPSGEIIPLLIIGAVVGAYIGGVQANGTWNPFKWNWKSGNTWLGMGGGAVLGAAAAGAAIGVAASLSAVGVSSLLSASVGGSVGGLIQGGGFAILPGGDGNILKGAAIGSVSGFVGGLVGNIANNAVSNVMVNGLNISSPVIKGFVGGMIGGAVGGYAGGFTGGYLSTGDLSLANKAGLRSAGTGAGIGSITGAATQYALARQQGIDPWSGVRRESIMIGGPQNKVDIFAKDFNSETITNNNRFGEWPNGMKAFLGQDSPNPEAILFNSKFINNVIDSNSLIYNIGRSGNSIFYHGIELNTINLRGYNNINFVRTYAPFSSFKLRFSIYD